MFYKFFLYIYRMYTSVLMLKAESRLCVCVCNDTLNTILCLYTVYLQEVDPHTYEAAGGDLGWRGSDRRGRREFSIKHKILPLHKTLGGRYINTIYK